MPTICACCAASRFLRLGRLLLFNLLRLRGVLLVQCSIVRPSQSAYAAVAIFASCVGAKLPSHAESAVSAFFLSTFGDNSGNFPPLKKSPCAMSSNSRGTLGKLRRSKNALSLAPKAAVGPSNSGTGKKVSP